MAGVLFHLGVHMGDVLLGGSRWNLGGHFEDKAFVDLHKRMIGDWRAPWVNMRPWREHYTALVRQREQRPLWGVKDPRLALVFREFARVTTCEVRPICVSRRTIDAAASMTARGEQSHNADIRVGNRGLEIARLYKDEVTSCFWLWHGPMLNIHYELLTDDPAGTVGMIADYVGVPVTRAAVASVRPEWRHDWRGSGKRDGDTTQLQATGQHSAHRGGAAVAG